MLELTQEEKLYLLEKQKIAYTLIQDGDIEIDKYGMVIVNPTKSIAKCWCKFNRGKSVENNVCVHCGGTNMSYVRATSKQLRTAMIEVWEQSEKVSKWHKPRLDEKETLSTFFYVRNHPIEQDAIQILKIQLTLKGGNTRHDEEELVWKVQHAIDIVPGKTCKAYKMSRGNEVAIDMFDAFQLSSALMKNSPNIVYQNASGMIDFILKHKKLNQYTGYMDCFNLAEVMIPRNSFFMFYMYLYAQYPVVEFVVKMGYIDLVAQIMNKLAHGYNKENIRNEANDLVKILNCEATNGSMALTVPRYIADDLNMRGSRIDEYILWSDICQMSKSGTVSKEIYIKNTRNVVYNHIKTYNKDIPNVLKYGYEMTDVINYLSKQLSCSPENYRYGISSAFGYWRDYLNMCDLMGVEPDKFPSNIKTVHDNTMLAFKAKQNEMADKAINIIGEYAEKYIPKTKEYIDGDYVIIIPRSVVDLVTEGQMQHNCVGSYVNRIANKRSVVFFIRKKDEPNVSFVTAEYASGRLAQICYKNNQRVNDKTIVDLANNFCSNLKSSNEFKYQ